MTPTSVSFDYTVDASDAREAADRNGTGFRDAINQHLTVNVAYRFRPPFNSDTSSGWATYVNNSFGALSYRLDVLPGPNAAIAAQDVLINTGTGFIQAVPSQPYSAALRVLVIDSSGDTVVLQTWNFTANRADMVNPANGPGGFDCVHGTRVDGVRYDGSYTCDCTGSGFSGPLCESPNTLPLLRLPPLSQVVPAGETADSFVFAVDGSLTRQVWTLDTT
jgi:hypothetical protein